MIQQLIFLVAIGFAFTFWIKGGIRYDLVALIALSIITVGGVIPFESAFLGFSHPAVIIIASVLVMSKGIINTGFIDWLLVKLPIRNRGIGVQISILCTITALISAFVYDIGALAMMMPLAITFANKKNISPSVYLLPIAFSAHLGGFLTLIGNAPNLIVSSFRADISAPFQMFDFSHAGIWVFLAVILFISLVGWRIAPKREKKLGKEEISERFKYASKYFVPKDSSIVGKSVEEFKKSIKEDFMVCFIFRGKEKITDISEDTKIEKGDFLILRSSLNSLKQINNLTDLNLVTIGGDFKKEIDERSYEAEAGINQYSVLKGMTLEQANIESLYEMEVEAISRKKGKIKEDFSKMSLEEGDILLLRGKEDSINQFIMDFDLLPLAERDIHLEPSAKMTTSLGIFSLSVVMATLNILPAHVSFFIGAVLMVLVGVTSLKETYKRIDWPIIITLGSLIPFGEAMVVSGAAETISSSLLSFTSFASPLVMLGIVLAVSIILSDFVNTIGVAVLMAPIAILLANGLGVSVDPFLMAVAMGGACAFLTPVGHQVNLLVMRPGGFKFTDYWKVGLWLDLIVFIVGIIVLPIFWPF